MKKNPALDVIQIPMSALDPLKLVSYKVVKTTNTISPTIGSILKGSEVNRLISLGYKVTVTAKK